MVAVIHSGVNLRAILNYNEQKVSGQVATCIAAVNYPLDADDLTYNQKLFRLQKLADLNNRSEIKSVHISLNFDPSEQLSQQQLRAITAEYMQAIGFGQQPYLVYQHMDSGHPHVHICTTNIQANGKRISLHNLGKVQSEKARKAIEIKYGLVRAEDHSQSLFTVKPVDVAKVIYGKTQTKRAISAVLSSVLKTYRYSSLAELNAVLSLYNVAAERGSEDSRTFKYKGLFYRVLGPNGEPVGVPIKASSFHDRPVLKSLEDRFIANDALRQQHKSRIKNVVDFALMKPATGMQGLVRALKGKNIDTVVRANEDGVIYGITYVDHQTRCVLNGSALGKPYSAKGILERCVEPLGIHVGAAHEPASERFQTSKIEGRKIPPVTTVPQAPGQGSDGAGATANSLLDDLMQPEYTGDYVPSQWKKKRRKKRKNQSNNL